MMNNFFLKLTPISKCIGFIQGNIEDIVKTFVQWQTPLISEFKNSFDIDKRSDCLEAALLHLYPLSVPERRRYLFIPTASNWVAFFDNGIMGTDSGAPNVIGEFLQTRTVYIQIHNATGEQVFSYEDRNNSVFRSVGVIKESKWTFYQAGEMMPFENPDYYKRKKIKDRFSFSILEEYLEKLGIEAYNPDFYQSSKYYYLIKKVGPCFESTKEISFEQVKNSEMFK